MKKAIVSGAVAVLGLVLAGPAQAGGKGVSRSGMGMKASMSSSMGHGFHSSYGNKFSSGSYGMKFAHGTYYPGKYQFHWTKSCWSSSYGCKTYWCPSTCAWYYWCVPDSCYYPVTYCPYQTYCW